jgi:transposase
MTRKGSLKARQFKRAMILLNADEGLSDPQIMAALNMSRPCVERIRKRFVTDGIERALNEDPRPGQKRKLGGRAKATLIATACAEAPKGREHWTLRLLADKLIKLQVVDTISYETVRRILEKTSRSPGGERCSAFREPMRNTSPAWKMCWICTNSPIISCDRRFATMNGEEL